MPSCCKLTNCKKMECQIGKSGECAICVRMPCGKGDAEEGCGGNCFGEVKMECCEPKEMDKCCQSKRSHECCVCMVCENGKLSRVVVLECGGLRQELRPASGNAVCISVPQNGGGGQVRVRECPASQMDKCCSENTADGQNCCVCVHCDGEGKCQALVCCPEEAEASAAGAGQCSQTTAGCCA